MPDRKIVLGGAVPPNWSIEFTESVSVFSDTPVVSTADRSAVNLVQKGSYGDLTQAERWPPRDQRDRGTCTAFAVVAAEELYRRPHPQTRNPEPLSEEYFYAAIRSFHARNDAGVNVDDDQIAKNDADGSTYLAQAREALINKGLCARNLMEYIADEEDGYFSSSIPDAARQDAATRQVARAELVHNIIDIENGSLPPGQTKWIEPLQTPLADVLWLQLSQNIPVVASFAIMDLEDWFEGTAWDWGEISYQGGGGPDPIGGHTVCLTGYVPPVDGDSVSGGWFQFRNSLGPEFADDYEDDDYAPQAIAEGYGHISAKDLNTYCWEYLYRASSPGG